MRHKMPAIANFKIAYHVSMDKKDHLEKHLELCQSVYEHLKKAGQWPWRDSQNSEDLLESEDIKKDT